MKRLFTLSTLCFIMLTSCIRPFNLTGTPTEGAMPTSVLGTTFTPTSTNPTPEPVSPTPSEIPTLALATPSANQFGVIISGQDVARPEIVNIAKDLGVKWVRLNVNLGRSNQEYTLFLASGINVILTISNEDPSNINTTYGTQQNWPNAGFPFKSRAQYQEQIREVLQPALPYLAQGREVWVQAENEISDASVNPASYYWRGTDEQYLAQLQALYEAVKSVNANIPVILTSFASRTLDALIQQRNARHEFAEKHVTMLLTQGQFDLVDLHFYGCVEDIPAKVEAVKKYMPAGKPFLWISTENGGPDSRCPATPLSWKHDLAQFEQLQAEQVSTRLLACAENGGVVCLWFSLFDLKNSDEIFSHLGLIDQDSTPPRKKPAYEAFKALVENQK